MPKARIGRYEIQGELGRGTMGIVYRAHDPELGRTIALKTVSLAFAVGDEEAEAFRRRFLEEARIAALLSHPGIVVVHDVGRDAATGDMFIALEHLQGRTLAELTAGGRGLPWKEALRILSRVARALHHAHTRGVVHRDVKPANIMVLDTGEPKILDFGVAKAPASQLTAAGQFFGTPAFMSPEQASSTPVDARSDVFSLGSVLFQALTGRRPYEGDTIAQIVARVLHDDPPAPSRLVPVLDPAVDAVVARALAKDPARRYSSAAAMADDLEAVLEGRPLVHASAADLTSGGTLVSSGPRAPAEEPLDEVELLLEEQPKTQAGPSLPTTAAAASPPVRPQTAGRRPLVIVAAAATFVLAAAGWMAWPPSPVDAPSPGDAAEATARPRRGFRLWPPTLSLTRPAQLALEFRHHVKEGTLRVWVDDDLVYDEPFAGGTEKILALRVRKGTVRQTLAVPPGRRTIKLEVDWDGRRRSGRLAGDFESGVTRRLDASLSMLTRDLALEWR